jgi:anti-sigma B factor antagonist
MLINQYVGDDTLIVEPVGRLTAETTASFTEAIGRRLDTGWDRLVVDLESVNYLDSAGLGALVHAFTSARRRGARMVLVHVNGKNKELLVITKLVTVFDVYETIVEAERSFPRTAAAS